ncbi:hypothetical protein CTI12_AA116620 [Artemisia annua]|uniref:Uncharacterized protein n=1 Tax=Artemisia annua TaxID=35608 RepID=A0A2U1PSN0_ARTAN|nr:hypothetical protein CTI12_AA116620 [Artemisia annua]
MKVSSYAKLTKNEPDPVTRPSSFPPVIGKGKGKVDDLYNSAVYAFVTRSQIPEHNIPSPECGVTCVPVDTRFHSLAVSASVQQQNRNNNNVHVHDVAGEVASSSVAAENDYLFRREVPQGVERQCFTGHVDPGVDVDPLVSAACLRRHLNADFGTLNEVPSDTNTENVVGLPVSGSDTCKVQPAAQSMLTCNFSAVLFLPTDMFCAHVPCPNLFAQLTAVFFCYSCKGLRLRHVLSIDVQLLFGIAVYEKMLPFHMLYIDGFLTYKQIISGEDKNDDGATEKKNNLSKKKIRLPSESD